MQGVRPFGDRDGNTPGGVAGNVAGVASRSEEPSIALYKGKSKYSEWVFINEGPASGAAADQPGPAGLPGGLGGPPRGESGDGMGGLRQRLGGPTR